MSGVDTFGLPRFEEIEVALASDAPHRWGLTTSRQFTLIAEPNQGAIWLLCPAIGQQTLPSTSPTSVISISFRNIGNQLYYQVGATSAPLLREVYYFLCGVVYRAEQSGEAFPDVIEGELAAWDALLRTPTIMDRNREIGLLGELWVAWRILQNLGPGAISFWTGPSSEQHDFRLPIDDLEVKATLSHSRDHAISGLQQLVTCGHRSLSVISIQLKPAGGGPGASLRDAVERISLLLSGNPVSLKKFSEMLAGVGYSLGSTHSDRYCLRSNPTLIPVDDGFPRLTPDSIACALSSPSLKRIRKVIYTVNLDGMGTPLDLHCAHDALRPPDSGDLYA